MKKVLFIFLILFLSACNVHNYNIEFSEKIVFDSTKDLYFPTPIKNNSVFIGFRVVEDKMYEKIKYKKYYGNNGLEVYKNSNEIYKELSYDLLKNHQYNDKLKLKAEYRSFSDEELFKIKKTNELLNVITANELDEYPRELTIPGVLEGVEIDEIDSFAFYGIEEIVFVNIDNQIDYVGKYAFANTHLYKLDFNKNADETAFSNTLLKGQSIKPLELNFITDSIKKEVYINDRKFIIEIDLNGGKIIEEELELGISRPVLENKIFLSYENESGRVIEFGENNNHYRFSLKEYFRYGLGFNYNINSKEVSDEIFRFKYLEATDSYALYLLEDNLYLSKLILPSMYRGKKITEIRDFNNKYVSEVVVGEFVEKIGDLFSTPKLKKITLPESLIEISAYAFSSTLLTDINLPKNIRKLQEGVFAYTFINKFTIPATLDYIHGSSFARCKDIKFNSNNNDYIVSKNQSKVYYKDFNYLALCSSNYELEIIDLTGVKEIGEGVFSYYNILSFKNYNYLKYVNDKAFYNSYIVRPNILDDLDYLSDTAFLDARIKI